MGTKACFPQNGANIRARSQLHLRVLLQVRALCAELARARGGTAAMGRSLLPVLQGVELRLEQLRAGAAAPDVTR
jgi:hypothetical protein